MLMTQYIEKLKYFIDIYMDVFYTIFVKRFQNKNLI